MAFNKEKNLLKGISNVVEATSLEEQVHGLFGAEIISIIRKEHPEWFDQEMVEMIHSACMKAYKAECEIVDWMYEEGDLDFLPKETVKEFIKNRFNVVLQNGKFEPAFEVDKKLLESTDWFEVQLLSVKEDDFFYKTSNAYNKKSKSITEDDLFD
jgi:ribonucleoside-diphosphate reductase beta chain